MKHKMSVALLIVTVLTLTGCANDAKYEWRIQSDKIAAEARRDCQYASQPTVDYKNLDVGEIAILELGRVARANLPDPCASGMSSTELAAVKTKARYGFFGNFFGGLFKWGGTAYVAGEIVKAVADNKVTETNTQTIVPGSTTETIKGENIVLDLEGNVLSGVTEITSESNNVQVVNQPGEVQVVNQPGEVQVVNQPGEVQVVNQPGEVQVVNQPGEVQVVNQPGEVQVIYQPGTAPTPTIICQTNYIPKIIATVDGAPTYQCVDPG